MLSGKARAPLTKPKTRQELGDLKRAVWIIEKVLREMESPFGRTERDVAKEIRRRIHGYGARPSFRPIVATGRSTGFVHHRPGERVIRRENPLLMDLGARVRGQCSDITRMHIPAGDSRMAKIYRDALNIQKRIIRMVRPGMEFKEINDFYKRMMERKGYRVKHSIGHGLGPHIHERVRELKPGMVLTIEPGIYIRNLGGCRIEDVVLVKRKGAEVLSVSIPKRPLE